MWWSVDSGIPWDLYGRSYCHPVEWAAVYHTEHILVWSYQARNILSLEYSRACEEKCWSPSGSLLWGLPGWRCVTIECCTSILHPICECRCLWINPGIERPGWTTRCIVRTHPEILPRYETRGALPPHNRWGTQADFSLCHRDIELEREGELEGTRRAVWGMARVGVWQLKSN